MRISFALAALAAFATCTPLSSTPTPGSALTQIDAMSTSEIASDELWMLSQSDAQPDAQPDEKKVKGTGRKQVALREALEAFLKSVLDNAPFLSDMSDKSASEVKDKRVRDADQALAGLHAALNHMDSGFKGTFLKLFGQGRSKIVRDDPAFQAFTERYRAIDPFTSESYKAIGTDIEILIEAAIMLPGKEIDYDTNEEVIKKSTPAQEKFALDRIKFILMARADKMKILSGEAMARCKEGLHPINYDEFFQCTVYFSSLDDIFDDL